MVSNKERLFHSLHMELEDSIIITNVHKISDMEVAFQYKNKNGKLYIEDYYVKLKYSDNKYTAILNSYQDVIDVLLERNEMVK